MNFKKTAAIVAAAGAFTALAIPAFADTTMYGSARVATFWDTIKPAGGGDKNTDFDLRNQSNSRFGVNFASGNLGGRVELGVGPTIGTRLIYGTYKFDAGTLMVGQNYTPYWANSDQAAFDDQGNNGYGSLYDGRQPQVKMSLTNGVYVSLIRPGKPAAPAVGTTTNATATAETFFPKVAVGYEGKAGACAFGGGIVGQIYKNSAADKQVSAAMGYVHARGNAGPVSVLVNLGIGQNLGDMDLLEGLNASVKGTKVENNLTISGLAAVGYTVSSSLKVNAGLGYVTTDGKVALSSTTSKDYAKADNKLSAFVNAPITLAKGVTIVPEFTYQDQLDDTNLTTGASSKGQKDYIYGAKWQMDF